MPKQMTFDVLPLGPCVQCLEAMLKPGKQAFYRDIGHGREVWGFYCPHTRAGSWTLVLPDQATRWNIFAPISFEEFAKVLVSETDDIERTFAAAVTASH